MREPIFSVILLLTRARASAIIIYYKIRAHLRALGRLMANNSLKKSPRTIIKDTANGSYILPSFLSYLVEDEISEEEFYKAYSIKKEDAPLWWKRDVPVALSKKDKKKALKAQRRTVAYLEKQLQTQEKQYAQYVSRLDREEETFQKKIDMNSELINAKLSEIELNARSRELYREKQNLEMEAQLLATKRAVQEAELLIKNEEILKKKQLEIKARYENGVDTELARELKEAIEKKDALRKEYLALHQENMNRAIEDPRLPMMAAPVVFDSVTDEEKEPVYELYNKNNAIEFIKVSYKRDADDVYLLNDLSFNAKKGAVTILRTDSKNKVVALMDILSEIIPEGTTITQGVARAYGEELFASPIKNKGIVCYESVLRQLASGKKVNDFTSESAVRDTLVKITGSDALLTKKLKKSTDEKLRLIALAVCFSLENGAVVISNVEDLSVDNYNALVKLINEANGQTIVALTTSTHLVIDTTGADVYKF